MTIKVAQYNAFKADLLNRYEFIYLEQLEGEKIVFVEDLDDGVNLGVRLGNVSFYFNYSLETIDTNIIPTIVVFKEIVIESSYDNIDILNVATDEIVSLLGKYCFTIAPNIGISGIENLQCTLDSKVSITQFEELKASYDASIFDNHINSFHIDNSLKQYWNDKLSYCEGIVLYSCSNHYHPNYISCTFQTIKINDIEYSLSNNLILEGCGIDISFDSQTNTINFLV